MPQYNIKVLQTCISTWYPFIVVCHAVYIKKVNFVLVFYYFIFAIYFVIFTDAIFLKVNSIDVRISQLISKFTPNSLFNGNNGKTWFKLTFSNWRQLTAARYNGWCDKYTTFICISIHKTAIPWKCLKITHPPTKGDKLCSKSL